MRGDIQTAHELGEQLLSLAETVQDSGFLLEARIALGNTFFFRGDLASAYRQFERALELYDPEQHRSHAFMYGLDPGVIGLGRVAWILWLRGYPDQALQKVHEALAHQIAHPFSLAVIGLHVMKFHLLRGESRATQQQAETTITLCEEHGFTNILGQAVLHRGWALAEQGFHEEGIVQIRQGLAVCQVTGAVLFRSYHLAFLVAACWRAAQTGEGLSAVTEAFAVVDKTGEWYYETELYRLKDELTLQKFPVTSSQSSVTNPQSPTPNPQTEAEACFLKAIEIARRQQAKSWELRASTSLAHLWQRQGKTTEAHQLLAEVYGWFTEGFGTKDLQEAKTLLEELS